LKHTITILWFSKNTTEYVWANLGPVAGVHKYLHFVVAPLLRSLTHGPTCHLLPLLIFRSLPEQWWATATAGRLGITSPTRAAKKNKQSGRGSPQGFRPACDVPPSWPLLTQSWCWCAIRRGDGMIPQCWVGGRGIGVEAADPRCGAATDGPRRGCSVASGRFLGAEPRRMGHGAAAEAWRRRYRPNRAAAAPQIQAWSLWCASGSAREEPEEERDSQPDKRRKKKMTG
jgi:hypothetical protein